MKLTKYISILLISVIVFPINHVYAKSGSKTTVAVVPVHDGANNALSDTAADRLRGELASKSDVYVVEKEKMQGVLKYYDRDIQKKDTTEVEKLLAKAKDSYYNFNYIEAKSLSKEVISRIAEEKIFDHGDTLLNAYLTLGIISRSMGNVGEARQAFAEALRLDPNYRLDSRAFPPSMVNVFESVRKIVDEKPKGTIKVTSNPKAADVFINGIMRGVTPLEINDVPEGEYYVRISANKYTIAKKKIEVKGKKTARVNEKLDWTDGAKGEMTGKEFIVAANSFTQVDDALSIADLMRVDKVLLVSADGKANGSGVLTTQMIDSKFKAGHSPVISTFSANKGGMSSAITETSKNIISQAHTDIAANPAKYTDPKGLGDPELLGAKNRKRISKPLLYGLIGGSAAAVGLGVGLAMAFSGGSGSSPGSGTGAVNVQFR